MLCLEEEQKLYKSIGQFLIDSIAFNQIEKWDSVQLQVIHFGGVTEYDAVYIFNDDIKSLRLAPIQFTPVIKELKKFTESNSYTPWNKFDFSLTSNHSFNIKYCLDQEVDEEN